MASPLTEQTVGGTFGYPPYHESAFKRALRYAAIGMQGLSAVPRGANFGEAFLAAAGAGSRSASAAQALAQQYAEKQAASQRQAEQDALRKQFLEAEIEKMSRPTAPPKEPDPLRGVPWYVRPEYKDTPEGLAARRKAEHIAAGKGAKAPTAPKPAKIPRRVPSGYTEQDIINSINQESDPANLAPYITGRGGADSPDIRRAAQLRANDIARQMR